MRRNAYICFVLLSLAACDDEESRNCVVKEVIQRHNKDIQWKEAFVHDGKNYTERKVFVYDPKTNTYPEENEVTSRFAWYEDGRVLSAKHSGPDYYKLYEYTYDHSNADFTLVNEHVTESIRGNIIADTVYKFHYIESPKDGNYRFDNVLEVYENGNLVKLGFADPKGTFEAYDTTWAMTVSYRYDNARNTVGNYVFRGLIYTLNWGHCRNNMIEEIYNDGNVTFSKKQSFAFFGNSQLNRWEYEDTGTNLSFIYECK
jgi:hypothetical protein